MKANARRIKRDIQRGEVDFLDVTAEIIKNEKLVYSDNYGITDVYLTMVLARLLPFLELLYYGSKHSRGLHCEHGFSRVVLHNDVLMLLTYNSGPDSFVTIEKLEKVPEGRKVVTVELLKTRFEEEEKLKSELRPVIAKYIEAGLTFEEITKYFVEIMKDNN